jgi:hypothetical protein
VKVAEPSTQYLPGGQLMHSEDYFKYLLELYVPAGHGLTFATPESASYAGQYEPAGQGTG